MELYLTPISCGILQAVGVIAYEKTSEQLFKQDLKTIRNFRNGAYKLRPIIIFSDVYDRNTGGAAFAFLIKKHNLGKVTKSTIVVNKNTNHKIAMWTWYLDHKAIAAFGKRVRKVVKK